MAESTRVPLCLLALCKRCETWQPHAQFPLSSAKRGAPKRRRYACRTCQMARARVQYAERRRTGESMVPYQTLKANDPEAWDYRYGRTAHLRKTFGITPGEFDAQLAMQGGVCALCKRSPHSGEVFAVDHCHDTGRLRAVLCTTCNRALGVLGDDVPGLARAYEYVRTAAWGEHLNLPTPIGRRPRPSRKEDPAVERRRCIREWAVQAGVHVARYGSIPPEVIAAYAAAHPEPSAG